MKCLSALYRSSLHRINECRPRGVSKEKNYNARHRAVVITFYSAFPLKFIFTAYRGAREMDDIEIIQLFTETPPSTISFTTVHASSFIVCDSETCRVFPRLGKFILLFFLILFLSSSDLHYHHFISHNFSFTLTLHSAAWNIKWAI